jgi:hypothetical protein
MGMYIQWKDDKNKQSFKPKQWQPMLFDKKDAIVPTEEGKCFWEAQLHLTLPKTGRPTYVKMNFSRDYKGKNDTTGTNTYAIPTGVESIQFTLSWYFNAKPDTPISCMVYHNGTSDIVSEIRQFKGMIL